MLDPSNKTEVLSFLISSYSVNLDSSPHGAEENANTVFAHLRENEMISEHCNEKKRVLYHLKANGFIEA